MTASVLLLAAPASGFAATTTVLTEADTYVAASSPTSNYGTATSLRADKTPRIIYARFAPQGVTGTVTKATLRVYTTTSNSTGFEARSVAATIWNERTVTYNSRPAVSSTVLSRSGAISSGQWLSFDVTGAVNAGGPVTLALMTSSSSQLQLSSRESGSTRTPRLVIDSAAPADTTAPTAPTNLQASAGNGQVALSWSPSSDAVGVSGYRVYQDGALVASPTATSFTATGLVNGRSYAYSVKAIDAAGNLSVGSTQVSATPQAPPASGGAVRPYDARSPWNTPIGADPGVHPLSPLLVGAISDNNLPLTSNPDQYTIPVYHVDDQTPLRSVKIANYFSSYDNGDNSRVGYGFAPTISNVPIPDEAAASSGTDGQIVLWDATTGVEYVFFQFAKDSAGNYTATGGSRYHTTAGYFGRFADGKAGRGAGTPYLAGLVRPWEIAQGRIDHALAFGYGRPSNALVYPASKTDGLGLLGVDLPMGTRLQLDPALTDAQFGAWGLSPEARTIARALQTYGMYVVDNSGASKVYLEDRSTAGWPASVGADLVSDIPWSAFRVVDPPAPPQ